MRPRAENSRASPKQSVPKSERGRFLLLIAVGAEVKRNCTLDHFFQCDRSRLMFSGIDFDPRAGAALELLAAFGRQNNQTILGINLWSLRLFGYLVNLFVCGCHQSCLPPN